MAGEPRASREQSRPRSRGTGVTNVRTLDMELPQLVLSPIISSAPWMLTVDLWGLLFAWLWLLWSGLVLLPLRLGRSALCHCRRGYGICSSDFIRAHS